MKRTKIIATIGPATENPTIIANLIRAGVNVFRQNFSHDIPEMHTKRIRNIKKQAKALNMPVAILADLQGPKIRVGDLSEQGMDLKRNQKVILTIKNPEKGEIPIQYKSLPRDVSFGDILLLDDGKIELKVFDKNDFSIKAKVIVGGILKSFKGINLPTASISAPALTAKDKKDLELILKEGVDFIALSFVRSADDIIQLRKIIEQNKGSKPSIVAKIERHEAVENLNEIIKASDAIMVARGDLGIELMLEKVPVIQKEIIKKTLGIGKPVIVATQMLESMMDNPRPTRAEVSDIANAVIDGADAIMLSGETSVGKYPLGCIKVMKRVSLDIEHWSRESGLMLGEATYHRRESVVEILSKNAVRLAEKIKARLIITATATGNTARQISKYRLSAPIMAVTHSEEVQKKLQLSWGILPFVINFNKISELISKSMKRAQSIGIVKKGDLVVITSGVLRGVPGGTNLIEVVMVE